MKERETIPVYARIVNGRTLCICIKGCDRMQNCERDIVERDRFRGWQETMKRDRYGR